MIVHLAGYAQQRDTLIPQKQTIDLKFRRMALVIGNSQYKESCLKNPENDADSLAQILHDAKFAVTLKKNLSFLDTRRVIRTFLDSLQANDIYLIYYAGYGIFSEGQSYIVPVDAVMNSRQPNSDECISVAQIKPADARRAGILILDASFHPIDTSDTFLPTIPPDNTMVVYAGISAVLDSDQNANNSPFNHALCRAIERQTEVYLKDDERLDIHLLLVEVANEVKVKTKNEQSPLLLSRLNRPFYFHLYGTK